MKTYIGTKIIQAEPAFRIDGRFILRAVRSQEA